jgi:hypothetical protein
MKELLKKFSTHLLSKQQTRSIKGGFTYCICQGTFYPKPCNLTPCNVKGSGGKDYCFIAGKWTIC